MEHPIVHDRGMDRDGWDRLVKALDAWTSAGEIAPDQIEVTVGGGDGTSRRVVIVMTSDQWDDMAGAMWGDFDAAPSALDVTGVNKAVGEAYRGGV